MSSDATEQRRLAAIMFTDMVGYSALAQRDEALGLELLEEHRRIIRGLLPHHAGREVKTIGDGFLIEFSSALEAARCAVEIQHALNTRNRSDSSKRQILVRIGIHVGDVVLREGDIHGDGVNIAARLEPLALPGGICISEDVARQIRNKIPNRIVSLGPRELKNIELPIVVHRLVMPWEDFISTSSLQPARASVFASVAILAAITIGGWWLIHQLNVDVRPSPGSQTAALGETNSPNAVFPSDPELQRAWALVNGTDSTLEDFLLAEDIVKNGLAQHASDLEAVLVYAWINNGFINRGFDVTEERYVQARRYTGRAVALSPNDPEALAALGQFLSFRRADMARAEELLRRSLALNPNEPRFYRALSYNVLYQIKPAEGLSFAEQTAARFPREPLVFYDLALQYRSAGRIEEMEHACDRALVLSSVGSVMWLKAWAAAWWHGDVKSFKMWLDRIPANLRFTERMLFLHYQYACMANDPGEALRELKAFPGDWLRDASYAGPKGLLIGDLLALEGKPELARVQYEEALAELARDKTRASTDLNLLRAKVLLLLGLNRLEEARAANKLLAVSAERPYQPAFLNWWTSRIPMHLLLGDRETAVALMKEAVARESVRRQIRVALNVDPRMLPWRDDVEIIALLAAPIGENPAKSASGSTAQ